ncbi:hypothetical protein F4814DRAFT_455787 [Daldinia grandis]|nr:hypothetical protein F4814DRAFT_455787 [Daldinia grandis]
MCQQWLLKFKSCGHFERDEERVYCEHYDPAFHETCLRRFGADIIREYTPGDGECCRCSGRKSLDEQWDRTISREMDDIRLAFSIARECLFSFNFVTVLDLQRAQDLLTYVYLSRGVVLDVRDILKEFGYKNTELEAEVSIADQNTWNEGIQSVPSLKDYMYLSASTPRADNDFLFGTVTPVPMQDSEVGQGGYTSPSSNVASPWSVKMSEL